MRAELIDGVLWVPQVIVAPGAYGDTMVPVLPDAPEFAEWVDTIPGGPITAAGWDESEHPRDPGGEGGGQFVGKADPRAKAHRGYVSKNDDGTFNMSVPSGVWYDRLDPNASGMQGELGLPEPIVRRHGAQRSFLYLGVPRPVVEETIEYVRSMGEAFNNQEFGDEDPYARRLNSSMVKWGNDAESQLREGQVAHVPELQEIGGFKVKKGKGGSFTVLNPDGTGRVWLGNQKGLDRWLRENGVQAAGFDPALHPHRPSGPGGGQWAEKGGGPADGSAAPGEAPVAEEVPLGLGSEDEQAKAKVEWGYDLDELAAADHHLREWVKNQQLHMRVPESSMLEVFNDGEFYNQHQHGDGARGLHRGVEGEAKMFGVEAKPEALPKYGYLGPDTSQTNMYGPIKVNFKPEVLARTTFTMDDSLMQGTGIVVPTPVLDASHLSMSPNTWGTYQETGEAGFDDVLYSGAIPYAEAQVWGKLTPEDIESVEILDDSYWDDEDPDSGMPLVDDRAKMEAVISELDKRGIKWSTYQPEGDFSGEWA